MPVVSWCGECPYWLALRIVVTVMGRDRWVLVCRLELWEMFVGFVRGFVVLLVALLRLLQW